ncbi:unnamed protein product, partial [Rotaria socialis]
MRVCRGDDQSQQNRQRELRSYHGSDQQSYYPQYQQQVYSNYPTMYDHQQQQNMISPR